MKTILLIAILSLASNIQAEQTSGKTIPLTEKFILEDIAKSSNKVQLTKIEIQELSSKTNIKQFILTKAATSAPGPEFDVFSILKRISKATIVSKPAPPTPVLFPIIKDSIWEAIIITKTDTYYITVGPKTSFISSSKKYAYLK